MNGPRPPSRNTVLACSAEIRSASFTSEEPPGLCAEKSTSSALKSVGLRRIRAPFESVH